MSDKTTDGMNDADLISYCESHCTTERALFNADQVNRMIELAGNPPEFCRVRGWVSAHEEMAELCNLARARLATPPAMNAASPTENQRTPNPFPEGSPNENWRRGYEGVRHFGAPDSEAAKHWKMGRAARRADDAAPVGQGSATSGEAAAIESATANQDDFEAWSKREGAFNLTPAGGDYCEDFRFPATYYYSNTETAWRAWANGRAALAAKAEQADTPVPRVGGITCPKCGVDRSVKACPDLSSCGMIGTAHVTPVAERAAAPASVPEGNELPCPACGGSGETMVLSGGGPDAYEIPAICPHCNGLGGLDDAYRGVCALLAAEQEKYLKACAKLYFAAPEVAQPAAQGEMREALYRLRNECDLAGLRSQAGFDCWLSIADKALATPAPTAGEPSAAEECTLCNGMGIIDGAGSLCPHCDGEGTEPDQGGKT